MKLGFYIGYSGAELRLPVEKVLLAERLGFDFAWPAESWGTDVVTVLSSLGAKTQTMKLGAGIMQIPARTPSMAAA